MQVDFKRIMRWIHVIEDIGRITSIVLMTGLVALQVIFRIFFEWSSPAWEEAARFIMIWSIFIGAIVTTRENGHIKMGGIFNSGAGKKWFDVLEKCVCIGFMIIFVVWSWEFAVYSIEKSMQSIVLRVPLIVVHICFLVCSLFIVFHFMVHLGKHVQDLIAFYRRDRA